MSCSLPTWSDFARSPAESERPELWTGLVGAWVPVLGPSGDTLVDLSPWRRHAASSSPIWTAKAPGSVLSYNGSSDYSDAGRSSLWALTTEPFSLECWFSAAIVAAGEPFGRGTPAALTPYFFWVMDGYIRFYVCDGSSWGLAQVSLPGTDRWCHVVGTRSGTALNIYLNGALQGSGTGFTTLSSADCPLTIGCGAYPNNTKHGFFNGSIALAAIYRRAMSAPEVAERYADPLGWLRRWRRRGESLGAVGGPYRLAAAQTFHTGARRGQLFHTGQAAGVIDG